MIDQVRKNNPNFANVIEKLIAHNVGNRASLDELQVLISLKSLGNFYLYIYFN